MEIPFIKTHSLELLIGLCLPSAPDMLSFLDHAVELSPLATEFRYPGDVFEPSHDEASHALHLAEEITNWISNKFADLSQP